MGYRYSIESGNVTKRKAAIYMLSLGDYRVTQTLSFGSKLKVVNTYDTYFGPTFFGKWLTYRPSATNLDKALTRITGCRGDYASEKILRNNLHKTLNGKRRFSRVVHSVFNGIRSDLTKALTSLSDSITEMLKYSQMPHPKKGIRRVAMQKLLATAKLDTLFTEQIKGKLKLYEKAKPGKYPRLIGDYSTEGSLLAGFLCDILKQNFSTRTFGGMTFEYVKSADASVMDRIGYDLINNSSDQMYYFSDDTLFKLNGKYYEMDISKCDVSNTMDLFYYMLSLFDDHPESHEIIRRAIAQCKLPLVLRNPEDQGTVVLNPDYPIEFSGTTLTTALNNVASLLIGLRCKYDNARSVADIIRCAFAVGYEVTCTERQNLPSCQFLKHSWSCEPGRAPQSFLNLGAMLRSFGSCRGDLPGHGDIRERAYRWNSAVVLGYKHSGGNPILSALLETYDSKKPFKVPDEVLKHFSETKRSDIPLSAYCARYCCQDYEILRIATMIREHPYALYNLPIIHKIYNVDYGL